MVRTIKAKCEYCNKLLWNIPRHLLTCKAKKRTDNLLSEPEDRTAGEMMRIREENSYLKRQLIKYQTFIEKIKGSLNCKCMDEDEASMTLEAAARTAIVKEATKRDYLTTVKQYSEFCAENKLSEFKVESANQFLGYLNLTKRTETVKKRRRHLSSLMKIARPEKPFPLQKVSSKDGKLLKHILTQTEVEALIDEAFDKKRKDLAVLIDLLHTHALRINAACSITGRSLKGNILQVYDSKVSMSYKLVLQGPLLDRLAELIEANKDVDSYVFFPDKTSKQRVDNCTNDFNNYLDLSAVNPQDSTKFTTHMFRTSVANNVFKKEHENALEKVKTTLKHSSTKTSLHYIRGDNTFSLGTTPLSIN